MNKGLIRYMDQVVCNSQFTIVGFNKDALVVKAEPDVLSAVFLREIYGFLQTSPLNYTRIEYELNGIKSFADICDLTVSDLYERYQQKLFKKYPQAKNIFFTPETKIEKLKKSQRRTRIHKLVNNVCKSITLDTVDGYASWSYETCGLSLQDSLQYAFRLGKYLQYLITRHNVTIDKVLDNAIADTLPYGMSKAKRNVGIAILIQIWKYGNELACALYS